MSRTTAHRTALAAALVAPADPVSRAVARSPEGGDRAGTPARSVCT
ncbi:hypothetical protein AB0420_15525 [Streptomyces caelestis]|uniref:Uncharacterized protein n=1 Tax=Streptomyces heliomycini TaxID=284032 RepID=A0ABV5LLH1_9ACTN|nr:hypothetical protein [Streptomyces sp. XY152]